MHSVVHCTPENAGEGAQVAGASSKCGAFMVYIANCTMATIYTIFAGVGGSDVVAVQRRLMRQRGKGEAVRGMPATARRVSHRPQRGAQYWESVPARRA